MSPFTLLRTGPARNRSTGRRAPRTRGQSLVEFALVIPILLFLTLIALDFGRVYLGYINLQNMARIAANFAANNSSAWDATPNANDAKLKTQYYNQIIADAQAINCQLNDTNGDGTLNADDFTPTFTDRNGNGDTTDLGDSGQVQIGCRFGVITPGIAAILGNSVKVAASSISGFIIRFIRERQKKIILVFRVASQFHVFIYTYMRTVLLPFKICITPFPVCPCHPAISR